MSAESPKIKESIMCPIPNCRIGVILYCNAYEINKSLEKGKVLILRKASHPQGCGHYATEEATIIVDEEGIPVNYILPYSDPNTTLEFSLLAQLIPYGDNITEHWIATNNLKPELPVDEGLAQLQDGFDELLLGVYRANRSLLPPEIIWKDRKAFEAIGFCFCQNPACVSCLQLDINQNQ